MKSLNTSFGNITSVPDPAYITNAGQWYLLQHISSPLISYDHTKGAFVPQIAESWKILGATYTIKLKQDAVFSDGTPIRAVDVEASLKRLLIKKTATHFPLWKYIDDCEALSKMIDPCKGLRVIDEHIIEIQLNQPSEPFLLQLTSPEASIWSRDDINPKDLELIPTKFSGPYTFVNDGGNIVLNLNSRHEVALGFPNAPKSIKLHNMGREQIESAMAAGQLDVFIGDYIPFNKIDWLKQDVCCPGSIVTNGWII